MMGNSSDREDRQQNVPVLSRTGIPHHHKHHHHHHRLFNYYFINYNKVITTMVLRPLDDPT